MLIPVILAGGSGSRLWPMSRSMYPKQLLPLVSHYSLLQQTVLRTRSIPDIAPPLVVCNQEHRFIVENQLKQIGIDDANIILEPTGKNTAPAVTIAALHLKNSYNDPTLIILPSDHIIQDIQSFTAAISYAELSVLAGQLVTFGIRVTYPETGYGYIKTASSFNENKAYKVLKFIEKPDKEMAKAYLASGRYYWNSGIFMFQASSFISELQQHAPNILKVCEQAITGMSQELSFLHINNVFESCPSDSIDYAVMEKTQNAALIPLNAEWSDVGSWVALSEAHKADRDGNVLLGDVFTEEVNNCYVRSESRMLAVIGVKDHIIVETPDAVLVTHKSHAQNVKTIVNKLKESQRSETIMHRRVYRPWGHYEVVDKGPCFQVKRITVKPGASLSLQRHQHRSEHWVVVSGIAEVTRDKEIFKVKANESTYISQGIVHRLANRESVDLEIIEVQSGNYLGEDDIERFADDYGRLN